MSGTGSSELYCGHGTPGASGLGTSCRAAQNPFPNKARRSLLSVQHNGKGGNRSSRARRDLIPGPWETQVKTPYSPSAPGCCFLLIYGTSARKRRTPPGHKDEAHYSHYPMFQRSPVQSTSPLFLRFTIQIWNEDLTQGKVGTIDFLELRPKWKQKWAP